MPQMAQSKLGHVGRLQKEWTKVIPSGANRKIGTGERSDKKATPKRGGGNLFLATMITEMLAKAQSSNALVRARDEVGSARTQWGKLFSGFIT